MRKLELVEEVTKYDAPQVEVIEVEVEKGFAASDGTIIPGESIG